LIENTFSRATLKFDEYEMALCRRANHKVSTENTCQAELPPVAIWIAFPGGNLN
jgi:hypothetical protein